MIDRIFQGLTRGIELALAYLFIFAVLLNFANVIGRYAFQTIFVGSDEIQIFILIAMCFLGASVISWRRQHLRMDVLYNMFPRPLRAAIRLIERIALLVLAGFVVDVSFEYAWRLYSFGQKSPTAGVPMWIPHSMIWLGYGVIGLVTLRHIVKALKGDDAADASSRG